MYVSVFNKLSCHSAFTSTCGEGLDADVKELSENEASFIMTVYTQPQTCFDYLSI